MQERCGEGWQCERVVASSAVGVGEFGFEASGFHLATLGRPWIQSVKQSVSRSGGQTLPSFRRNQISSARSLIKQSQVSPVRLCMLLGSTARASLCCSDAPEGGGGAALSVCPGPHRAPRKRGGLEGVLGIVGYIVE